MCITPGRVATLAASIGHERQGRTTKNGATAGQGLSASTFCRSGYWRRPSHVTWLHGLLFAANVAQIRRERPQIVKCARIRAEIFLPIKGAANDWRWSTTTYPPTRNL
jgi:hypothetical protein